MSEEGKNATREIARDLVDGMVAMHEACMAVGCEPQEASRYVQSFRESEFKDLADSALVERVIQLTLDPHTLYQNEPEEESGPYRILGSVIFN